MKIKRKSVTLSDIIFGLIDRLSDAERLIAYDSINRPLFYGKEIDYKGLPDRVQDVLIVANYEIRKMQTKYKNGCSEKRVFNSDASSCQNLGSKNKQKKATKKQTKPSDYNINNISNYIYILNQSISQSVFLENKTQDALLVLVELAKSIKNLAPTESGRLLEAVERLSGVEGVKVVGKMVSQEKLATQIKQNLQPLSPKNLAAELKAMFENIDAHRTNDKINYSIVSLYNLKTSYNTFKKVSGVNDFLTRDLTNEQINSLVDNVDSIQI